MSGRTKKSWDGVNALYQVYIRSFRDTDADGVGDLAGVTERLDYLRSGKDSLGVDALLLTPFYESPMVDFGYDITNHCMVDPQFGTMKDFDKLIKEAHKRGIKVMVDIIPNHTSDQHPWFIESRSSRDSPKRDWYIWHDPAKGMVPPNNWQSKFGGSVWEYDELTEQYYYHTFFTEQPDLNWENTEVRQAIRDICSFWFFFGADGLRVDAAIYLSKDLSFQDDPDDGNGNILERGMSYGDRQAEYLREMTQLAHDHKDAIVLLEAYPEGRQQTALRYRDLVAVDDDHAAPLVVEGMWLPFEAPAFRDFLSSVMLAVDPKYHMPIFCFGNHDNQRLVSKFGNEQARAIAIIQMTLPGLPLIYYGEEIGMTNSHKVRANRADGATQSHMPAGRGVVRTPMQWDSSRYAGFSDGVPWLPHHAGAGNTVIAQVEDADSFLNLYRRLLELRRNSPALRSGSFVLDDTQEQVLVYSRKYQSDEYITVVNMSTEPIVYSFDLPVVVVVASHPADHPYVFDYTSVQLQPNEAVVLKQEVAQDHD